MKIGITGYSGSLGKTLIKINKSNKIYRFKGDIRKKSDIKNWFKNKKIDAIFHLAAIVPIKIVKKNKKKAYEVNYLGTKNVVDIALKNNIKWFFFASTSHVYKSSKKRIDENGKIEPISFYGKTKFLAEKFVIKKLEGKINYCIGRIFSTTNKNQKQNYLVPDLKNKIKKTRKKIKLKNLNHYRDFISMEDISNIIFILMKKNFSGIINIGSGRKTYLKDIAKIILKKYKKKANFIDISKSTYLLSDNFKLKKIINFKINSNLNKMIF